VLGGIAVYIAPFGSRAFASLFDDAVLTRPAWNSRDGVLKYRVDGMSKVTGEKVFARDIRARDMPHWPPQQAHALALRVTKADRRYAGFDLSALHPDLQPDRIVTAADLARDGLDFPRFYGKGMLLGEGETPAYLGQAVAILIYREFARFRFAKEKLQFNDTVIRYGEVTGPLQRDPWGASRFVRVGGKTPRDEDGRRHLGAVGLLFSEVGRRRDSDRVARPRLRRRARIRRAGNPGGDRAHGRRDRR
jgi:hypothetical protein